MIQIGNDNKFNEKCHGCEGKGWVVAISTAQKCPVCEGSGLKPQGNFYYPPVTVTPNIPFDWYTNNPPYCTICGVKGCTTTHISCYTNSKDIMGNDLPPSVSIMRFETQS